MECDMWRWPIFLLLCLCGCDFCFLCFKYYFFFRSRIITGSNGNILILATMRIVFHSCCFACSVIGSVIILFMWKLYAAGLCPNRLLDVKCIVVSVCVDFLWIPTCRTLFFLWMEISKYVMLLFSSSVNLNSKYFVYVYFSCNWWLVLR